MKNKSYGDFWQKIHVSAKRRGILLRVMFELTYRCNFECRHCYIPGSHRRKRELNTKEIFSILDQLKDAGCFYLGFTGGEPFMRKDMLKILRYAKKCGFETIIYTNGSLIDEKTSKELSQIRPSKVDITVPAVTKDAFDKITGLHGSRNMVFKAIELLHRKNVNLGIKTCLLKENESEISRIQDFSRSIGASHRLDTTLSVKLNGSRGPFRYKGQFPQSTYDCSGQMPRAKNRESNNAANLFECGSGKSQAAITPAGELKICLMINWPKIRIAGNGLPEAWRNMKRLVEEIKPDKNYKCGICDLKPCCGWCPATAWLYNKTFTSCAPDSRIEAKKLKEAYA